MFWNMLGASYGWSTSKTLSERTRFYWLNNACVEFEETTLNKLDKLYQGNKLVNELSKEKLKYTFRDHTTKQIPLDEIAFFADITNGAGNWFGSPSRIDALYKVIDNSEAALTAKNINLEFAGKFFVSGSVDQDNIYETGLTDPEKKSIIKSLRSDEQVITNKTGVALARFVENLGRQKLDEAYTASFYNIGSMYGIPKEVLDASLEGSTYENQEKATGRHVAYALQPKAEDLANGLERYFGYTDKQLYITFDHLPFMQVFEIDKAEVAKTNAETLKTLIESGVKPEDAAAMLEMNVSFNPITNE